MAAIIDIHTGAHLEGLTEFAVPAPPAPRAQLRVVHGGRSPLVRHRRQVFLLRRLLAVAVLAVVTVVGVQVVSMVASAFMVPGVSGATSIDTSVPYVVQRGDSLWAVAQRVAPMSDPREVVDQIVQLNAGSGVSLTADSPLQVGQRLVLPAGLD
jgi:hypothetical protein